MSREKVFISILMVSILIVLSGVSVWAAPLGQEPTTISGIVEEIEVDEETNTVFVTLALVGESGEPTGETQRVRMSLAKAQELGLVDGAGNPSYPIDPITITLGDDVQVIQEVEHPVALALAAFFDARLGLEEGAIMGYHEDGLGFGVIAQACWMAYMLKPEGENNTEAGDILAAILAAKKSHVFTYEDGTPIVTLSNGEIPKNWGQFKNAVLKSEKPKKNLGYIMSGRAERDEEQEEEGVVGSSTQLFGKGKDKGGKPDAPPGQVKNQDKGKGGGKNK